MAERQAREREEKKVKRDQMEASRIEKADKDLESKEAQEERDLKMAKELQEITDMELKRKQNEGWEAEEKVSSASNSLLFPREEG